MLWQVLVQKVTVLLLKRTHWPVEHCEALTQNLHMSTAPICGRHA